MSNFNAVTVRHGFYVGVLIYPYPTINTGYSCMLVREVHGDLILRSGDDKRCERMHCNGLIGKKTEYTFQF